MIRELMTGPKRYKDLLKRLPGIGTNLLAQRLKFLEEQGILARRRLPPPASTDAYALTELGYELEPIVIGLVQWGYRTIPHPQQDTVHYPGWSVLAMKAVFRADKALGLDEEYEYRVDDEIFHARIRNGALTTAQGEALRPAFVLETDGKTFLAVVSGEVAIEDAIRQDRVSILGNQEAFARSLEIFDLTPLHERAGERFPTLDLTGRPGPGAYRLR